MASGQGALIGLSNMITARAEREKKRQLDLEDEQRQNQSKIIDQAIASGNLNQDQITAALDQKKKLYPKEVHPMIDKMGEVLGHVFNLKKNSQQAMSEQSPVPGVSSTSVPSSTGQVTTSGSVTPSPNAPITSMSDPRVTPLASSDTPPAAPVAPTATNTPAAAPSAVPPSMASILSAANPNPVTKAKTAAQAQLAGDEVIQSDRNTKAKKLIEDMRASGTLTPQLEQVISMESQGFTVPASMLRPVMGRQMQPDVKDSVLMGVKNPETNEYYTDPKSMPPEAKAIWDTASKGLQDKADAADKKQQTTFEHQMAMQEQAMKNALAVHDHEKAKDAIHAAQSLTNDAIDRMKTMDSNLIDLVKSTQAGHPNQQAALSLVAHHIGMTLGLQKGARITKSVWDEAQESAPWLERVGAKFSSDGYLTGLNITPEQGKQMVALAHQRVQTIREREDQVRSDYATDLGEATSAVPPKMKTQKKGSSSVDDQIMDAIKKAKSGG